MTDRKAVIEYGEEKLSRLHPDETNKDHIGVMVEVGWIKGVLELLKTPWTLAKERLPEAKEGFFGTPYIVLTKSGSVIPLWFVEKIIRGTWVRRWEYYGGHIYHGDVIAWAPMPEPPKAGEHE